MEFALFLYFFLFALIIYTVNVVKALTSEVKPGPQLLP